MTVVKMKIKSKGRRSTALRCDASGYKVAERGFYTVSERDGKTICDHCGKAVRLRAGNEYDYIPVHNALT